MTTSSSAELGGGVGVRLDHPLQLRVYQTILGEGVRKYGRAGLQELRPLGVIEVELDLVVPLYVKDARGQLRVRNGEIGVEPSYVLGGGSRACELAEGGRARGGDRETGRNPLFVAAASVGEVEGGVGISHEGVGEGESQGEPLEVAVAASCDGEHEDRRKGGERDRERGERASRLSSEEMIQGEPEDASPAPAPALASR